jgi:hypothetical protein
MLPLEKFRDPAVLGRIFRALLLQQLDDVRDWDSLHRDLVAYALAGGLNTYYERDEIKFVPLSGCMWEYFARHRLAGAISTGALSLLNSLASVAARAQGGGVGHLFARVFAVEMTIVDSPLFWAIASKFCADGDAWFQDCRSWQTPVEHQSVLTQRNGHVGKHVIHQMRGTLGGPRVGTHRHPGLVHRYGPLSVRGRLEPDPARAGWSRGAGAPARGGGRRGARGGAALEAQEPPASPPVRPPTTRSA